MPKLSIDIDVDEQSLRRTLNELERKVNDGAEKGMEDTLGKGKDVASQHVRRNRNPFTEPHLHSSFETHHFEVGDGVQGFITSPLDHAAYVDQGVSGTQNQRDTPFAYTDSKPPIQKLIPWVTEYLDDWDIEDDPPFDTGSLSDDDDDGPDPPPIADDLQTLDDGYSPEESFYGANVVIYDNIKESWYHGSVTEYDSDSVTIEFPNGTESSFEYDSIQYEFTHGEFFEDLSQDHQVNVLESELKQKEWDINNYNMSNIIDDFLYWARNTNDVSLAKSGVNRLIKVGEVEKKLGATSPAPEKLYLRFNDEGKADSVTFRHEFFHAIQTAAEYMSTEYPSASVPDYNYNSDGEDLSGDLLDAGEYMVREIFSNEDGEFIEVDEEEGDYEFVDEAEDFVGDGNIFASVEAELEVIDIDPDDFDGSDITLTVDDGDYPDLDVGDGLKVESTEKHIVQVIGEPEEVGNNEWEVPIYVHDEGKLNTLYIDEDSVEMEGRISDSLSVDIHGEIDYFYEPGQWEPSSDDEFKALLEAGNRAWFKIARYVSEHGKNSNKFKNIVGSRKYSARSPMEVLAVLSETLSGEKGKDRVDIDSLEYTYYEHPYLLEAWLDVFEPSEDAKEKLKEIGAWEDVS